MKRLILTLGLFGFLSVAAWSQEEAPTPEEAEDTEIMETEAMADEELDESDLDEQGFENEDDDFRPSEEIPADQSIAFPTDI